MLAEIAHWCRGTVRFSVRGDTSRFLTLCARAGIALRGLSREGELALASCGPADYLRLWPIARRARVRLRMRQKLGLPFRVRWMRKRPGLLAGALLAAVLCVYLAGGVWSIEVAGNERLGEAEVLRAAAAQGVSLGGRQSAIFPKRAANGMLGELAALSWVSVNTEGCFVTIEVREAEEKPVLTDREELSSIIARREGRVVAIEAERGRPEIALGDTVVEGQLLISGVYREKQQPYAQSPILTETLGAARGSVRAETFRQFSVSVPAAQARKFPAGPVERRHWLRLFGLRIPLGLFSKPRGEGRGWSEDHPVAALGVRLPLAVETQCFQPLEERKTLLSPGEQQRLALCRLRQSQREALGETEGHILEENLLWQEADGLCLLTADCRCEEEIGELQVILSNVTENGNKK